MELRREISATYCAPVSAHCEIVANIGSMAQINSSPCAYCTGTCTMLYARNNIN